MLKNVNKTIMVSATSEVENEDGTSKVISFMNASISTGGAMNMSQSVQDVALYNENAYESDEDFRKFKEVVSGYATMN